MAVRVPADDTRIFLTGGPVELPRLYQPSCHLQELPSKVSVPFYGRHQHFERSDGVELVDGIALPVYRWTYSTAIAE